MFNSVYFQYRLIPIENAGEPVLPDTEFRERTAGQRFEELVGIAPLRFDDLVELRDDTILHVRIERLELICTARRELPRPAVTRHPRPGPSSR